MAGIVVFFCQSNVTCYCLFFMQGRDLSGIATTKAGWEKQDKHKQAQYKTYTQDCWFNWVTHH